MDRYHYFVKTILEWHQQHGRHNLPWRKKNITPYEIWVSEVMLQQTQVNRVIAYYERFLQRFPNITDVANCSWEDFLPYYQGLGYYNRGKNMLKTAKIISESYNGTFPKNFNLLKKLPGIGDYTARAIMSFGYEEPYLAFDTNHQRVWGRYLYGDKNAKIDIAEIEKKLPVKTDFRTFNAAIMDFANLVCTQKNVNFESCPLLPYCKYCSTQGLQENSTSVRKKTFPIKNAQTFLFIHENHKKYFSLNRKQSKKFYPFILSAPLNTRGAIKQYFKRLYGLELSIRPPYKKALVHDIPTLFTRAQILLGNHDFNVFFPDDVQSWLNSIENDTIDA